MTHNRKPDVLPVAGASIAEALAHANTCEFAHCCGSPVLDIKLIRSALERAAAEGEARRWVPCSERMPEPLERVLVAYMTQFGPSVVTGYWDGDQWCILMKTGVATGNGVTDSTVAWQPLPASPKGSTP